MKLCTGKGNQKVSKKSKFEVSNSKNKKIGAKIGFSEGLEDTPFKIKVLKYT